MKKPGLILLIFLLSACCLANVPPPSEAVITEVYFDNNGDWTIEVYFNYFSGHDESYWLISITDTATFEKFPDSTGFLILTESDMLDPVTIDPNGDELYIVETTEWNYVTGYFTYGNAPGSGVNPILPGQSYINANRNYNYENFEVKDKAPCIGQLQEPPTGLFHGYVYDSTGNPIPYFNIRHEARFGIAETWTDSTGYFYNPTMMAKNYHVILDDGNGNAWVDTTITVEPDSIVYTIFRLPINSMITLNGHCQLQDSTNHSGIIITFTPEYSNGEVLQTTTDTTGFFEMEVPAGQYYFRCSKEGYLPEYSTSCNAYYEDSYIVSAILEHGNVYEISMGNQSGIWDNEKPYWLFGEITIPPGDTLQILAGAGIFFKRYGNFNIQGTLLAEGNEGSHIVFTESNWEGLRFNGETSSGSMLKYMEIAHNDSGIIIQDASPKLHHCYIYDNEQDRNVIFHIRGNSSPVIKAANFICDPDYEPIYYFIKDSSAPAISHQVFKDRLNYWSGFFMWIEDNSRPEFSNNVFKNLGRAIFYTDNAYPKSINNIFFDNDMAFSSYQSSSPFTSDYDCFYLNAYMGYQNDLPGFGELCQTNNNGDSCDIYHNIFMDPMFADTSNNTFHLTEESPCIDAGDPGYPYDPDSTIADMGAFYFDQLSINIQEKPINNPGYNISIVPNPTTGNATIILRKEKHLSWNNSRIRLFDLNGKPVAQDETEYLLPQDNEYRMALSELSGSTLLRGTYLLSLEIDKGVCVTKKLVVF